MDMDMEDKNAEVSLVTYVVRLKSWRSTNQSITDRPFLSCVVGRAGEPGQSLVAAGC